MTLTVVLLFLIMITGTLLHWPMYLTLFVGILPFFTYALKIGNTVDELMNFSKFGWLNLKKTYWLLILIGGTTALWNDTGTMRGILSLCTVFINPYNFLLMTFLVTWLVTLLLGSALGTAGTIGLLFINIAASANYSIAMTGGAIVSAIYIGERTSPVSTCANLVADVCHLNVFEYIRNNLKKAFPLVALITLIYGLLSMAFPIALSTESFSQGFSWNTLKIAMALLPIGILLGVTLLRKNVVLALLASMGISALTVLVLGETSLTKLIYHVLFGASTSMNGIVISGKGIFGMYPTLLVVMVSAIYGGLFEGSGIFNPLKAKLIAIARRRSLYFATALSSLLGAAIGCSQTFSVIFTYHLLHQTYEKDGKQALEFSNDLADTAVLLPALIPWNIAASVPALLLGTGYSFMPFAFIIYLPVLVGLLRVKQIKSEQTCSNRCQ